MDHALLPGVWGGGVSEGDAQGGSDRVIGGPLVNDAQRELQELWRETFEHEQSASTLEARAHAEDKWRLRRHKHLPLTLEVMLHSMQPLQYGREGQNDGEPELLLMVGYSEEQLALSIAAHVKAGCRKIVPFSTLEAWTSVQSDVVACLFDLGFRRNQDYQFELLQPIEPNDPANVFRKVMGWVRDHPGRRPAIECTGGKKPMDFGSAYAASFYGLPAYYVDFDEYDPQLRRPRPWTCRYHCLSLPDAAFSLATRREVHSLFEARRFAEARVLLKQIIEAPHTQQYWDEKDVQDLVRAEQLIQRCDSWMQLRYDDGSLQDHKLHGYFVQMHKHQEKPRVVVEGLLQRDQAELLREYVVDEYWRLWSLWEKKEFREALIGCVGLVELAIDALLFCSWFDDVHVDEVVLLRMAPEDNRNLPVPEVLGWRGGRIDPRYLLPASHGAKVVLMKKGMRKFEIWPPVHAADITKLNLPRPGPNDPHLEVEVVLKTHLPPLGYAGSQRKMDALWKEYWGNYPNNAWVDARHALVHMRTPAFMDADIETGLKDAIEQVLPRFIRLLFRMATETQVDITDSADPTWVTWLQRDKWSAGNRLPWAGQSAALAKWLRLRV
jgi:hypothetical protein